MPKAGTIGLRVAVLGFALATQGCWEGGQEQLTLLGEGGCRLGNGGEGSPSMIQVASAEDCQAQCFADGAPCTAVEYNGNNGICEVHREPVAKVERVEGVACYAMR